MSEPRDVQSEQNDTVDPQTDAQAVDAEQVEVVEGETPEEALAGEVVDETTEKLPAWKKHWRRLKPKWPSSKIACCELVQKPIMPAVVPTVK